MNLDTFLAHAVKLEYEATVIYAKSAVVTAEENQDAAAFFREMAGYANMHLGDVMARAGYKDVSELPQLAYQWGNHSAPETMSPIPTSGDIIDLDSAMARALDAERRAVVFYEEAAQSSLDSKVRALALEFATEERDHVLALERFMGLRPY
ncbi:MAG: ferritin family protein [Rhodocyclaceae bacterium]|nr:ferritin family protein [Rhodocyclaceae bacterium]MDZ4214878.1 ferritin family protein [Rhodocyclaceae bacterium]